MSVFYYVAWIHPSQDNSQQVLFHNCFSLNDLINNVKARGIKYAVNVFSNRSLEQQWKNIISGWDIFRKLNKAVYRSTQKAMPHHLLLKTDLPYFTPLSLLKYWAQFKELDEISGYCSQHK